VTTVIIETIRVHPNSLNVPPDLIAARVKPFYLKIPGSKLIKVFSLHPLDNYSTEEAAYIRENFPYFHRKILVADGDFDTSVGGYLLSRIPGKANDDRFDSYFSAAEVILTPQSE
jgi:hypothetical protein